MSVVVTGAAGFIGRVPVEALVRAGEQVIGIDRRPQPETPGLTALTCDLLDDDPLARAALENAGAVFHLAGCPGVRGASPDIAWRRHRDNVLAGERVLATVPLRGMVLVAGVGTVAAAGIGVRARFGGHVAVDEPQYLLTALSIFEDFHLDISDELAARRWVPWAGVGEIPVQTEVLATGQQISPHDPLLLAVPMGLGGWIAAKATLALLTGLAAWRLRGEGRPLAVLAGGLALMGVAYLAIHRAVWGGWTVYASGDHFQESGEFGVMGFNPNIVGRGLRLAGLLADQGYGLIAWQPGWLLLVPAATALAANRRLGTPGRRAWEASVLLLPLAAGWLTATFVALTMHGHWWPGRQTVVVLPLALLAVLVWAHRANRAWPRRTGLVLGAAGVVTYGWLIADGLAVRITWVSGFEATGSPVYRVLRPLLPDYRSGWDSFWPLHLAWVAAFLLLIAHAWRAGRKDDPHEEDGSDRRRAVHRAGLGADRVQ